MGYLEILGLVLSGAGTMASILGIFFALYAKQNGRMTREHMRATEDHLSKMIREMQESAREGNDRLSQMTKEENERLSQMTKEGNERLSQMTKEGNERLSQMMKEGNERLAEILERMDKRSEDRHREVVGYIQK